MIRQSFTDRTRAISLKRSTREVLAEALERRLCLSAMPLAEAFGAEEGPPVVRTAVTTSPVSAAALPSSFVLDMVHHNPGQARTQTQFLDPKFLAGWGYNGQVMNETIQAAVTFDSFDKTTFPAGSAARQWVLNKAAQVDGQIAAAHAAGLKIYYWTDFIVLPKTLVSKYRSSLVDPNGKLDPDRSLTQTVLRAMLSEIFARFPGVDGLVVRTGEVYTQDVPYHTGNNPIVHGASSHITLLNLLRDEVCVKRNKLLIYRTWDTSGTAGFHANSAYYLQVTNAIATHSKLLFSIKEQAGDFQRMTPFNPTIGIGKHRQIIEVQSQREYEGKGSSPDYIGKGVIDGWEEYASINPAGRPDGLREASASPLFAGVWTWSRGGGWDGPYIPNDLWPRLNTYVIAKWAQDRSRTESSIFNSYATGTLGLSGDSLSRFRELSLLSADAVLRGRMSTSGGVNPFWTRDEYIGGTPTLRSFFDSTISNGRIGAVMAEKQDAVNKWMRIESLAKQISMPSSTLRDYLVTSATYGRIQYDLFEDAWEVMLYGLQGDRTGSYNRTVIDAAIRNYDSLWQEWRNLKASKSNCPTLYTDDAYRRDAANGVGAWVDKYRVPATTLQAEYAARSGATVAGENSGYSGSGYVDFQHASGDWVEWTYTAASARNYSLTFRYANGGTPDRPLELKVNGVVVRSRLSFPATGGWSTWKTVTTTVALKAGTNKVRLTAVGLDGPNLDRLEIRPI
jgi:hypothetical protein